MQIFELNSSLNSQFSLSFFSYMKEIDNKEIPRPVDLQDDKIKLVFNNIKEIYEWHRE